MSTLFRRKTFQGVIVLFLLMGFNTSALAESVWDGQPYFGLSAMMTGARNSKVDEGTGSPNAAFVSGAEIITNVGYGLSLTGGWLFDSNWRTELELSRRAVALDNINGTGGSANLDGDLIVHTAFINVARDFRGKSWITPYVGAGIGMALHELDLKNIDGIPSGLPKSNPSSLAFQGLLGILLEAGEDTDILVGYRYVNYYAPDYSEFSNDFIEFHNFEVGVKFYPEGW